MLRVLLIFSIIISLTFDASAQRKRFYNALDLQINLPQELDSFEQWFNAFSKRQFVKNPQYGRGHMFAFHLSMRHLDTLSLPYSPIQFIPKDYPVDSGVEPFTPQIFLHESKGYLFDPDIDLSALSMLKLIKMDNGWSNGKLLYNTTEYIVNDGKQGNQRYIPVYTPKEGEQLLVAPDYDDDEPDSYEMLIDSINSLLGASYPKPMKFEALVDSIKKHHDLSEEELVYQMYFQHETAKSQQELLYKLTPDRNEYKYINKGLKYGVKLYEFPFNINFPSEGIKMEKLPVDSTFSELNFEVFTSNIKMFPYKGHYAIKLEFEGNFVGDNTINDDLPAKENRDIFYIHILPERIILSYYNRDGSKNARRLALYQID